MATPTDPRALKVVPRRSVDGHAVGDVVRFANGARMEVVEVDEKDGSARGVWLSETDRLLMLATTVAPMQTAFREQCERILERMDARNRADLLAMQLMVAERLTKETEKLVPKSRLKLTIAELQRVEGRRRKQTQSARSARADERGRLGKELEQRIRDLHRREGLAATEIACRLRGEGIMISRQRAARIIKGAPLPR
jgi:hypothetical protein